MLPRRVLLSASGVVVLVLLVGGGRGAWAGPGPLLYASTGDANSNGGGRLYTIDPVAQTVTLIGNTGLSRLGALAFDGNRVLYGADGGSSGPSFLYTINSSNGTATFIGALSGIQGVDALAFDAGGTLYGGGWDGNTGRLLTINPANANILSNIVMSGSGNSFVPGLAFSATNQLFGSRGNASERTEDLIRIDLTTGQHTPIGVATNVISDIWFDAAAGTLYGGSPTGDLFIMDPLTGGKTLLFNTGIRIAGLTGLSGTVVIDGCDSGVFNAVFPGGGTISDLIVACAEGARNHGKFVSCVSQLTNQLKKVGIITGQQKGAIQSCATQANIP